MNQPKAASQFDIERQGVELVGRPMSEVMTLEQAFGPLDQWLLPIGPYHLLYMPIHDRWLYWDWVHETWQDTGHKAFEVEFYLEGDQILTRPAPARSAPGQEPVQQTYAQHHTPPLNEPPAEPIIPPAVPSFASLPQSAVEVAPPAQVPAPQPADVPPPVIAEEPEEAAPLPQPVEDLAPDLATPEPVEPGMESPDIQVISPPAPVVLEPELLEPEVPEPVHPPFENLQSEPDISEITPPDEFALESTFDDPDSPKTPPHGMRSPVLPPLNQQPVAEPIKVAPSIAPPPEPVSPPPMPEPVLPPHSQQPVAEPIKVATPASPQIEPVSMPPLPKPIAPVPPAAPATPPPSSMPPVSPAPVVPPVSKPVVERAEAKTIVEQPPPRKADEFAATMLYKRPAVWELRVLEGAGVGVIYRLKMETTIGRSSDNVISLDDPMSSRHHARLEWAGEMYIVTDLGSSNGTFVNEQKIEKPTPLEEGNHLLIGQTHFIVQKKEG